MLSTIIIYFNAKYTALIQRAFKLLLISSNIIPLLKSKIFLLKKKKKKPRKISITLYWV